MRRIFSLPQKNGLTDALIILAAFIGVSVPFGLISGILVWSPSVQGLWTVVLVAFFLPALFEELVFRAPLLFVSSGVSRFWAATILLILFVLWHPLNGSFLMTEARELFTDPRFLIIAFGLGMTCTFVTIRTGSLWPAILVHWLVVVSWKGLFGGPQFFGSV